MRDVKWYATTKYDGDSRGGDAIASLVESITEDWSCPERDSGYLQRTLACQVGFGDRPSVSNARVNDA
ncbi:hypothetical protein QQS21_002975 [Conoideocrella luteorostrata]|uniref:Uncharacterized protein n=1 Tax=Conoideocrella luteorostrata TaxID=1105319 RepID=A0AAJ0CV33_9HYPO|nr:hypothetical protein QQS21_002975 [Conoideocrella luteorostrata]